MSEKYSQHTCLPQDSLSAMPIKAWQQLSMEFRPKIRYWLPAAMVDEKDLRAEIRALYQRGFGGIEVISLLVSDAVRLRQLAAAENGWGSERWQQMISAIDDEAGKLNMTIDLTNGPGWPIASPAVQNAKDQAILCELTYGEMTLMPGERYMGALPEKRSLQPEGEAELVHAMAYRETGDRILAAESYIDLMPYTKWESGQWTVDYRLPDFNSGVWKLFAFYQQPSIQKANGGKGYVIDHLSREGAKACETYWDKIFKENHYPSMESIFCDSLEYRVSMDWTPDMAAEFQKRRGYSLLKFLPFIGIQNTYPVCDIPGYRLEDEMISDMVNRDYFETITQLYCENHLASLEKMAAKYGKTIRYQVAYNKPIEIERSALYVSIPENEALGRASVDYQKTMAAAVHLGRKARYSFECAAEFGHTYGQDYEDLFWWVKRSLMAGMNAQVLHGASYSGGYHGACSQDGRVPDTQWPGFEGFVKKVSNNWNRTLDPKAARDCMDTITRLNAIFRKQAKVDCAIFRDSYCNDGAGSEFCLYNDGGILSNHGYSYEFVSEHLLELETCVVSDGVLDQEGVGYKCLIIPETRYISVNCLRNIWRLAREGWPVIWIGQKPVCGKFYSEWCTQKQKDDWQSCVDQIWEAQHVAHVACKSLVPEALASMGVRPEVELDGQMDILTAVRVDQENGQKFFVLYGYNRVVFSPDTPNPDEQSCTADFKKGTTKRSYERPGEISRRQVKVSLRGNGDIYRCNYWSQKIERLKFSYDQDRDCMCGEVAMQEDEMLVLVMVSGNSEVIYPKKNVENNRLLCGNSIEKTVSVIDYPVYFNQLELEAFEAESPNEVSFLRSGFYGKKITMACDSLLPWRKMDKQLEHFAGRGIYYGWTELPVQAKALFSKKMSYILSLGNVSDTFSVWVNGQPADFPDQVLKEVDITLLLHEGHNTIKVVVYSNLYNRLYSEKISESYPLLKYLPRDYGIWESEYKKIKLRRIRR